MMAFPSMLVPAAQRAGMSVPADPDNYDPEAYLRFHIFCLLQLGRRMKMGEHWDNAKVIAAFPVEKLKTATLEDFIAAGLTYAT